MFPDQLNEPVRIFPAVQEKKKSVPPLLQPTEQTGCIMITPENRDALRMITVKNPGMKSRIDFLMESRTAASRLRVKRFFIGAFSAKWRVEKEYFLSYHKEEASVSGRLSADTTEFTVKRVIKKNRQLYEIYTGELKKKPDRIIKGEQKLGKLGYTEETIALLRELIRKLPKSREKDVYRQIGDSIIQCIIIYKVRFWRRYFLTVICSTYYKGASRDSRRFFEKGYLPIESLLPDKERNPRYLIIDAGANPEFFPSQPRGADLSAARYILIPGEINFKTYQNIMVPYVSRCLPATAFLAEKGRFAKIARAAAIVDELIKADYLFVAQREVLSIRTIAAVFRSLLEKYRTLLMTVAGNLVFSFFYGFQEGTIINPLMDMLNNRYMILVWITTVAVYFYPVIESIIEIKSGIKFDEVRNAEKSRRLPRVFINEELRSVQFKVAIYYSLAAAILMLLYPAIFSSVFGSLPFAVPLLFALFFGNKLFKDWSEYYEANNYFRILIRTVGRDPVHRRNLLRIKALEEGIRTVLRVTGLAIGMIVMWNFPTAAIIIAGAGIAVGCGAKFIYPLFGAEYAVSITSSGRPVQLDRNNYAIIPEKVRIRTQGDAHFQSERGGFVALDPQELEIIIDSDSTDDLPRVKVRTGSALGTLNKKWKLLWPNHVTLSIELHANKDMELVRKDTNRQMKFSLVEKGTQ